MIHPIVHMVVTHMSRSPVCVAPHLCGYPPSAPDCAALPRRPRTTVVTRSPISLRPSVVPVNTHTPPSYGARPNSPSRTAGKHTERSIPAGGEFLSVTGAAPCMGRPIMDAETTTTTNHRRRDDAVSEDIQRNNKFCQEHMTLIMTL